MKNSELTDIQKKCKNYALSYSHLEMKKTKSKLLCDLFNIRDFERMCVSQEQAHPNAVYYYRTTHTAMLCG
jgi:hypothetical protein